MAQPLAQPALVQADPLRERAAVSGTVGREIGEHAQLATDEGQGAVQPLRQGLAVSTDHCLEFVAVGARWRFHRASVDVRHGRLLLIVVGADAHTTKSLVSAAGVYRRNADLWPDEVPARPIMAMTLDIATQARYQATWMTWRL